MPNSRVLCLRSMRLNTSSVVDIRNTYGALLIGLIVSAIFYGVTIAQTWNYYWYYRNRDRKVLQGFVAFLFSLDTLHTILCIYSVYWYLVLNFGNVEKLYMDVWAIESQTEINTLVGLLVQLYYARQLYIISNSMVFPAIIAVLGSVTFSKRFSWERRCINIGRRPYSSRMLLHLQGVCMIYLGLITRNLTWEFRVELKQYSRFGSLTWATCVGMGSASLADIIIALSMCWCLWHKRTGFARTDSIIMTLMSYSINSGLLTR
ncbi:hypothetical protein BC826DRAFT_728904 [Russula brevipes]|nr:hypothetical protein BC826DRAFT_728904 [Russula brevipes]